MYHKNNMVCYCYKYIIPILLFISGISAFSQQSTINIQLIDSETATPVSFAHFLIGNQKGVSDEHGSVKFTAVPNKNLQISHVLYGHVHIKPEDLSIAETSGEIELQKLELALQPALVMGLHNKNQSNQQLDINYQDMLSHDAGAFLEKNTAISSIKKSGSYGFDPVFRGFKYDQLNIVIDGGQMATAACPNRMDPPASQVSLNMMDRVEILKGPHSLRYGNSFGGTFHFISPEPKYSDKLKGFGRGSLSGESNGNIGRMELMGGIRHQRVNAKLFISHSQGNDYTDGDGEKIPSNFQRSSIGTNIDLKITKNQNLSLSFTNNIAKDVDFPSLPMDLRNDNTVLINARHTVNFSQKSFSSIRTMVFGTFVDHEMDNLTKNLNPRMVNATTLANTKSYGGRTEGRINFASGWLYTGIDLRINEQTGERTRSFLMGPMEGNTAYDNVWQDGIMQQFGVFGESHFNLGKQHLIAAIRLDANNSELRDPAEEFTNVNTNTSKNYLNSSASLGLTSNIGGNSSIGLWIARAQRSGSLTELYINYFPVGLDAYEMLGNPELKPEVNNQIDLNYKWLPNTAIVDINVFASYLNDYISSEIRDDLSPSMPSSPGVRQYTNIETALMTGFEANWHQKLPANLYSRLGIAYTFAEDLNTNRPLPEIPPLNLRIGIGGNYLQNKLKPEAVFRYSMEQNRVSDEFGETATPAFTLVDLKIAYQLGKHLHFAAGINNIFNEVYYEHLSRAMKIENGKPLYATGRSVFATITVNFN